MFDIERVRTSWQREAQAIDRIVDGLDERAARAALRDDGWSAQDVLGHIATAARGFVMYIDGTQAGEIDINAFNHDQREHNSARRWAEVQSYWRRTRDETSAYLSQLDASIAQQPVHLPWVPAIRNAGDALRALIIHTRGHREELSYVDRRTS